jgi:hypothetical protein
MSLLFELLERPEFCVAILLTGFRIDEASGVK